MANIALTNGERYTFAKQGTVTVITDSTDSAEGTKIFNNNLTLSGSVARTIKIETSNTALDAYVQFKSSTTIFSAGVDGDENSFTIGTNTSLTGPSSTSTALRIPDVTSPKVHFDHGIVSSGSIIITPSDVPNYANDTAAAAGGVPVGGLYRNGSVIQIRVS
jgi:hypothetical protein